MVKNKADSAIWTNPASDIDPFADLTIPDNINELAAQARERAKEKLASRLRRFRKSRMPPLWWFIK